MSDIITATDPITTWAQARPTHRDPLYDLRRKREQAWQMYDAAIESGALDMVREFQYQQAVAIEAEFDRAYHQLYDPPQEGEQAASGCDNCPFDKLNCAVCEGRSI
jgi:hypothetical protein